MSRTHLAHLAAFLVTAFTAATQAASNEPSSSGENAGASQQDKGGLDVGGMTTRMKDALPGSFTYAGVTLYGIVDVAAAYQRYGAPQSGALYMGGLDFLAYGAKNMSRRDLVSFTGNGMSQSFVGIEVEENLGYGLTGIARFESGFNPWSGELSDACASLARNNGIPSILQSANLDGSRCGQVLNGPAYGGIGSDDLGKLTVGRQNSLNQDAVGVYDPFAGSYAFSLIGFSGGSFAGIGDTETARWDNSIKYLYTHGPAHVAAMYAGGGQDSQIHAYGYAVNIGASYRGFSIDFNYTKENSAVGATNLSASDCAAAGFGLSSIGTYPGCGAVKLLDATITDDRAFAAMAKYSLDLDSWWGAGGLKDKRSPDTLTFYAGYQYAELANPSQPVAPGSTTIGGYVLFAVNNEPFAPGSERVLQTGWAGVKYALANGWTFTTAWYHVTQNPFVARTSAGGNVTCLTASRPTTGIPIPSNCEGDYNQGSFAVDYAFSEHFDVYGGVSYSEVSGGLSSGYLRDNTTLLISGVRLKL